MPEAARVCFSLQRLPSHFNDVDSKSFSFLLFFVFCCCSAPFAFLFSSFFWRLLIKAIKLAEALAFARVCVCVFVGGLCMPVCGCDYL